MKKSKKKSTEEQNDVNRLSITTSLEAYYILSKIRKERGISVKEICAKLGISESAHYRYTSNYKSQKKVQPSMALIIRFCDVLDYDLRIVNKNMEEAKKSVSEAPIEKFVYSKKAKNKKCFHPKYLNKEHISSDGTLFLFLRPNDVSDYLYEISIYKKNPHTIEFSHGRISATKALDIAKKYNIDIFKQPQ